MSRVESAQAGRNESILFQAIIHKHLSASTTKGAVRMSAIGRMEISALMKHLGERMGNGCGLA
ncbi:hypothetical protein BCY88_29705 [Paraburkholderia fungorum]|uniref:Uncharacterized protein n=1 Tax=Paraburkholderia fungorum TaxID=134537 RepID=A0A420GFJ4_9BURK|nr:hypothetical protein BCY88_29705 [Paraburkholderia fungorum]